MFSPSVKALGLIFFFVDLCKFPYLALADRSARSKAGLTVNVDSESALAGGCAFQAVREIGGAQEGAARMSEQQRGRSKEKHFGHRDQWAPEAKPTFNRNVTDKSHRTHEPLNGQKVLHLLNNECSMYSALKVPCQSLSSFGKDRLAYMLRQGISSLLPVFYS